MRTIDTLDNNLGIWNDFVKYFIDVDSVKCSDLNFSSKCFPSFAFATYISQNVRWLFATLGFNGLK